MSKKQVFFILLLYVITSCSTSKIIKENGQCYARAIGPDIYQVDTIKLAKYIGYNSQNPFVKKEVLESKPASKRWEKRKDSNCRSSKPDDCLVYCLVEVPAEVISIDIVIDTMMEKNFVVQNIYNRLLIRKGEEISKHLIICPEHIDKKLVEEVEEALMNLGYQATYSKGSQFSKSDLYYLNLFQIENNLAQGPLDEETLSALRRR